MATPTPSLTPDQLDLFAVLEKVDLFYATAWGHLMIYITVATGLVGIALPIFISWWSQRNQQQFFKAEKQEIEINLLDKINEVIKSETESIEKLVRNRQDIQDEKMSQHSEQLNLNIDKKVALSVGGAFHVQALMMQRGDSHVVAVTSALDGAGLLLQAEDESNLQRALDIALDSLKELNRGDIEDSEEIEEKINVTINKLKEANENGRYSNVIEKLKKEFSTAKKRNASRPQPPE